MKQQILIFTSALQGNDEVTFFGKTNETQRDYNVILRKYAALDSCTL